MFVAPTGQFKTSITKTLDMWKPRALVMSDLTIRELANLRGDISAGKITTVAFMELPKIYGRNREVAMNVEGALHQMADEGFRLTNWESQNLTVKEARAFVVGAMPTNFYQKRWGEWTQSGWARRFIWCHFQLKNVEVIMDAIDKWQPLDFGKLIFAAPASGAIPFSVTEDESTFLRGILRHTDAGYEAVPFILLKKIMSVLKWRYSELGPRRAANTARAIMEDFAECLRGVADLEVEGRVDAEVKAGKPAKAARIS